MSVLIKGMEMPKCCDDCAFCEQYDVYTSPYCKISDDEDMMSINEIRAKRRDNCPLIPVPPHGRLGDLDFLNELVEAEINAYMHGYKRSTWDFICEIRDVVEKAVTIIPAEEGE